MQWTIGSESVEMFCAISTHPDIVQEQTGKAQQVVNIVVFHTDMFWRISW